MSLVKTESFNSYDATLERLKEIYHSQCLFKYNALLEDLHFYFSNDGTLMCTFSCSAEHQSYDGMIHGGIISAIIDASMVQCCMGHGVIAYTADLSIRYRKSMKINIRSMLQTRIVSIHRGVLYSLESSITQGDQLHIQANGRFFKKN